MKMGSISRKTAPVVVIVAITAVVIALVLILSPQPSENPTKWHGFRHDPLSVGTVLLVSDFDDAQEFMEFRLSYYHETWQGHEIPIENSIFNFWIVERVS